MIDAEDDLTAMLAIVAASTGLDVRPQRFDRDLPDGADLVLAGRGSGDPRDRADLRVARRREITRDLLASGTPFLAACLGQQSLADELERAVRRLKTPRQDLRQTISVDGRPERVGCYDTFVATSGAARAHCPFTGESVHVPRDPRRGAGHPTSKPGMRSTRFHVESVLTENGPAILRRMMLELVAEAGRVTAVPLSAIRPPRSSGGAPEPYGK